MKKLLFLLMLLYSSYHSFAQSGNYDFLGKEPTPAPAPVYKPDREFLERMQQKANNQYQEYLNIATSVPDLNEPLRYYHSDTLKIYSSPKSDNNYIILSSKAGPYSVIIDGYILHIVNRNLGEDRSYTLISKKTYVEKEVYYQDFGAYDKEEKLPCVISFLKNLKTNTLSLWIEYYRQSVLFTYYNIQQS